MKPRHSRPKLRDLVSGNKHNHNHNGRASRGVAHNHGTEPPEGVPVYTIALVLDDRVHEVLRAQEKLADIFISGPTFILVDENTGQAKIGMNYNDGKFTE